MKTDMTCINKKYLVLGAFSDNSVSFSHEDKNCPTLGFVYIRKQRYNLRITKLDRREEERHPGF